MTKIRIDEILVTGRYRKDLGDINALAKSVAAAGLINPITVTSGGQLIAGQRRMEACRSLGWDEIDAIVADDLDSAIARLTAERDENAERKDMTPQELVGLGKALERLERPLAAQRRAAQLKQNRAGDVSGTVVNSADTRDVVAAALGWSAFTHRNARAVVDAAADTTLPAEDRAVAVAALAEMNATGVVNSAYEKVRKIRDARLGVRQKSVITAAKKQRHTITAAAASLSGIAHGLKKIDQLHADITREEAAQWVDDLSESRRVIESLIKRLKERTNAQA